ncbi:MAG TPA: HEAT repeat domain-containing protein [Gemmataceae bacterium]|jgi:HEAT repeat protein
MSKEQLLGLAADVNRLLAAGATVAARHEGLSQRARVLRELSRKVAALTPLADAVERVVNSTPRQAGAAFLDLVVMTRQIQGSLAGAGVDGPLRPIDASGPWQTLAAVRDIASAHETLIGHHFDRAKAIRNLAKQQLTGDVRLLSAVMRCLEDGDTAVADLTADEVLPAMGRAVLGELIATLDLNGKASAARRLRAICRIDPKIGLKFCRQALKEGSSALKIQALACLPEVGAAGEAEQAGLQLCRDKNKNVRLAALDAMSKATSDTVLEVLIDFLTSEPQVSQRVAKVLAGLPHPRTTDRLLQELEATQQARTVQGKKSVTKKIAKQLLKVLAQRDDPVGLEAAAAWTEDEELWEPAARAAWKLPEPRRFERLAPLCADLSHPRETSRERGEFVMQLFDKEDDSKHPRTDWDPRWGDVLLPHLDGPNRAGSAVALSLVRRVKAVPDLLRILPISVKKNECQVVIVLGKLRAREAIAPFIELMPGQQSYHFCIHDALRAIADPAAIPPLQELLAKTRNRARCERIQKVINDLEKASPPQ